MRHFKNHTVESPSPTHMSVTLPNPTTLRAPFQVLVSVNIYFLAQHMRDGDMDVEHCLAWYFNCGWVHVRGPWPVGRRGPEPLPFPASEGYMSGADHQ